jgi:hypothetical protein
MGRWPDPADSATDRARAIAYSYREALLEVAPDRVEMLDRMARELGEHWIAPQVDTATEGELVSTERAAELMGVDPSTIRSWGSRSFVPVSRRPGGWDLEELRAYKASQRRRRGHR